MQEPQHSNHNHKQCFHACANANNQSSAETCKDSSTCPLCGCLQYITVGFAVICSKSQSTSKLNLLLFLLLTCQVAGRLVFTVGAHRVTFGLFVHSWSILQLTEEEQNLAGCEAAARLELKRAEMFTRQDAALIRSTSQQEGTIWTRLMWYIKKDKNEGMAFVHSVLLFIQWGHLKTTTRGVPMGCPLRWCQFIFIEYEFFEIIFLFFVAENIDMH